MRTENLSYHLFPVLTNSVKISYLTGNFFKNYLLCFNYLYDNSEIFQNSILPFLSEKMNAHEKANALFKDFWEWRVKDSPEFATLIGVHAYDDKLQSYTLESFEQRKTAGKKYLDEALELLAEPEIKSETRLNLNLFIYDLEIFLKGLDAKGYVFPLNFLEGVHIEFERLITDMPQKCVEDYYKILSRFQALPQQISELIEIMREGIRLKLTYNNVSLKGLLEQLNKLQMEPQKSCFYKPFASFPETIPENERKKISHDASKLIAEGILPAFKTLHNFLKKEYFNHLRPNIAISSLPGGEDFYQKCLNFHLGFNASPQEVHDMGLNEVTIISGEIEKVIKSLELNISVKEFSDRMREDEDFYFNDAAEILEAYRGLVFNKIEPKLPQIIKKIPKAKLIIEPSPPSMSSGPMAYYLAGTFDGTRPGKFYVNTANVKAAPKYDMVTLALHEALPGHHLQMSYMMESENVPEFRRYVEDRKYSEAPSRFPLHTAFIEGWGLYSEYLGYELQMYDDVYFHYGHLSYEMFRACRLVVDTGIHAFGWTRKQAVDYMLEHTATARLHVESEIDRYITWPGQACAYKVGELKIKALRKKAEKALGSAFDVKEFHDIILQGAGPLSLLEQTVIEYIQKYNE